MSEQRAKRHPETCTTQSDERLGRLGTLRRKHSGTLPTTHLVPLDVLGFQGGQDVQGVQDVHGGQGERLGDWVFTGRGEVRVSSAVAGERCRSQLLCGDRMQMRRSDPLGARGIQR
jgi:hypothetical protein